jgi:putative hemolysin
MGVAVEFVLVLVLILINGALAMSEMAVVAAGRPRLRRLADEGDKGALTALELSADPGPFLSTIQIGITLVGILIGAFGGVALGEAIAERLAVVGPLQPYAGTIAVFFVVTLLTYLTLVLGELVPKQLALGDPARIAAGVAPYLSGLARVTAPLVAVLSTSSNLVLRLLGRGPADEPGVTEEDIRIMLEQGAQTGVFEPMEEEIVGQVFQLADREIGALMTPRSEIVWIDEQDSPDVARRKVIDSGRSRLPVAKGFLDEVTGIVLAKDLLAYNGLDQQQDLSAVIRPPLFVPENTPALAVVERFKETHSKIAIVIDEYGGVDGLVTVDDILGALIGDIAELDEPEEPTAIQRDDGSWLVDGLLLLDELQNVLGLAQLPDKAERYRTAGGMVMALRGQLPVTGDRVAWEGFWFEVVDMDGRRVDKILVTPVERPHDQKS